MSISFSTTVSKVTCIDVLNNSLQDIVHYCSKNNVSNTTKMWLEHLHQNLHQDSDNKEYPHKFYFESFFHIGGICYAEGIDAFNMTGISTLGSDKISFLPDEDIIPAEMESSVFAVMESQIINNESLSLNKSLQSFFEKSFKEILDAQFDNRFIDSFVRVTNQLAISPKVLFAKYQIDVLFLDDQNVDVDHLILSKIYYKNLLPVFFIFKDENNKCFMAWNKEYLLALLNVEPVNFNKDDK